MFSVLSIVIDIIVVLVHINNIYSIYYPEVLYLYSCKYIHMNTRYEPKNLMFLMVVLYPYFNHKLQNLICFLRAERFLHFQLFSGLHLNQDVFVSNKSFILRWSGLLMQLMDSLTYRGKGGGYNQQLSELTEQQTPVKFCI